MSTRTITKSVVSNWASVPSIPNTLAELCVIWASGNPAQPCSPALPVLIGDLKQAFVTKNLDALRPSDMVAGGSIRTVEALISFIAASPSRVSPAALASVASLPKLGAGGSKKKPASKSKKRSASKRRTSRKSATKGTKTARKKSRKRGVK